MTSSIYFEIVDPSKKGKECVVNRFGSHGNGYLKFLSALGKLMLDADIKLGAFEDYLSVRVTSFRKRSFEDFVKNIRGIDKIVKERGVLEYLRIMHLAIEEGKSGIFTDMEGFLSAREANEYGQLIEKKFISRYKTNKQLVEELNKIAKEEKINSEFVETIGYDFPNMTYLDYLKKFSKFLVSAKEGQIVVKIGPSWGSFSHLYKLYN